MLPLDLHVLSLSLAFILSQDQTLHCTFIFFIRLSLNSSFIVVKNRRWYFLPCTYTTFLLFSIFQRTCLRLRRNGLQSYNIFLNRQNISKKIFIFFFSNFCSLTRRQPLSIADAKLLLFLKIPKYF